MLKDRPRLVQWIAGSVLLGALMALAFSVWRFPPRPDRSLHSAIGRALAREALELAGSHAQVNVITRDTTTFRQPALDILFQAFSKELRAAGATLGLIQKLQTDPIRPLEVPSGDFFEMIRRGRSGQVIVSFLGPPLLTEEQRRRLGTIQPKIVAFCPGNLSYTVDLKGLFQAGLLHSAIVTRAIPPSLTPSAELSFDALYRITRAGETEPAHPPERQTP